MNRGNASQDGRVRSSTRIALFLAIALGWLVASWTIIGLTGGQETGFRVQGSGG